MKELRALDESALLPLRDATAKASDPELVKVCTALCKRLEFAVKGGGDSELTALALLAILSAGYSPLANDDSVPSLQGVFSGSRRGRRRPDRLTRRTPSQMQSEHSPFPRPTGSPAENRTKKRP